MSGINERESWYKTEEPQWLVVFYEPPRPSPTASFFRGIKEKLGRYARRVTELPARAGGGQDVRLYSMDEVAEIIAKFTTEDKGTGEMLRGPLCRECRRKKGPGADCDTCPLDDMTDKDLAMKWLERMDAEKVAAGLAKEWMKQQGVERTCQNCGHHDDHIKKCLCGDAEIVPDPVPSEPPCAAWEPRKESCHV